MTLKMHTSMLGMMRNNIYLYRKKSFYGFKRTKVSCAKNVRKHNRKIDYRCL